ncbi:MBL fold metallo-hydrolase [Sphingomicrobium clamense]|uniref:MBL fold metallo-hydrolase n=1 Tax=Sphingomicrobium clamense TaxID=2851013 RepID=A0ABS6V5W8_9SPHN|nr:MBL fold metallo-hydrolase [Sphingomicrobium sp. B8]MBW0144592.1 MBL fold metallo-hydrolase [Sphingomicrobium sp. B8]
MEPLEDGIARLLAENPSPFTYTGTQTYFVGGPSEVIVVDPGPAMNAHVDAILDAIGERKLVAITCTHTHRDHSPASRPLKEATGAPIIGCAPLALETAGPRADASFDADYAPDRILEDGDTLEADGFVLTAVATPGHTSNHLCYAVGDALLTGDHVMGWSTTVVVPPDGDMGAYMDSLEKLRLREDRVYYPAHGPQVDKPSRLVRHMIGHRMQRERQILKRLEAGDRDIETLVLNCYPGLDPRLRPAAGGSVTAHLVELERQDRVERLSEDTWKPLPSRNDTGSD